MSKTTDPIKLLVLEESQQKAEDLVVLLRNAGRATRAQQILSEDDLLSTIQSNVWDLLVAKNEANGITAQQCLHAINNVEKDIPLIIIADSDDPGAITDGLQMGAKDVALASDKQRLILMIERELENLEHRRARRKAEIDLRETDKRNQILLDTSSAAIAYVHDGMHIYTNNAYANMFDYHDPDDFAGIPIIDLIASKDQEKFKKLLKSHEDELEASDEFTCLTSEGNEIQSHLSMSRATYEGESCTQVIFRPVADDSELEERIKEISSQDLLTGLYNRQYFSERLDAAVDQAHKGNSSVLFYIDTDQFSRVRAEAGIANADIILTDIANVLKSEIEDPHVLARFGEDVFTCLYISGDKEKAQKFADKLRAKVEAQIFEVQGKTFQITVRIGMSMISESTSSGEDVVTKAHQTAGEIEGGNAVRFFQPKAIQLSEDGEALSSSTIKELLKSGIKENNFKLRYSPIISLQGDDDGHFEVHVSLKVGDDGELTPDQFRVEAEELNIQHAIDRIVIRDAIKALTVARKQGSRARLFINISPRSAADDTFLPWISVALKAARLPSDSLIFQIHENDAHSYIKHVKKFMSGISQLHCKSSITNYGCALNPQNILKHLSPDYVQIDPSFLEEVDNDEDKKKELLAIVKSLQSKGILTAISGVESHIILPVLFESGVHFMQGEYVSDPLDNLDYDFSEEM